MHLAEHRIEDHAARIIEEYIDALGAAVAIAASAREETAYRVQPSANSLRVTTLRTRLYATHATSDDAPNY